MLDMIQEVIGMLAGIVGLLYITGGVIVNLHLSRFGVSEYQILKAKYLAVGLSFLISVLLFVSIVCMVSAFVLPVVSLLNLQVRLTISTLFLFWFTWLYYSQRFRQFLKRLWSRVLKCIEQKAAFHFWVLAVLGISLYPVSFVISDNWTTLNIQRFGLYSAIAVLYGVVGFALLTLYFGVELYANPIPAGPQAADLIGTGKLQRIRLVGKPEDFELIQKLGVKLDSPQLTSEVGLLDETKDHYLIVVENKRGERAVKIDRGLVKGISYTPVIDKRAR